MTVALPIEYGSLNFFSVLGGLGFYNEIRVMTTRQLGLALGGLAVIIAGIATPFVAIALKAQRERRELTASHMLCANFYLAAQQMREVRPCSSSVLDMLLKLRCVEHGRLRAQ